MAAYTVLFPQRQLQRQGCENLPYTPSRIIRWPLTESVKLPVAGGNLFCRVGHAQKVNVRPMVFQLNYTTVIHKKVWRVSLAQQGKQITWNYTDRNPSHHGYEHVNHNT